MNKLYESVLEIFKQAERAKKNGFDTPEIQRMVNSISECKKRMKQTKVEKDAFFIASTRLLEKAMKTSLPEILGCKGETVASLCYDSFTEKNRRLMYFDIIYDNDAYQPYEPWFGYGTEKTEEEFQKSIDSHMTKNYGEGKIRCVAQSPVYEQTIRIYSYNGCKYVHIMDEHIYAEGGE